MSSSTDQQPAAFGAAAGCIALLVLACAAAPVVARVLASDATAVDLFNRLAPPSAQHLLGTDELGRDLLLRLLEGGRVSLIVGVAGALGAAVIGITVGATAGLADGRVERFLMRLTDGVIALPLLPLLIVLAALDLGKLGLPQSVAEAPSVSIWRIVALVALFGWTTIARLTWTEVTRLKRREFVIAARALGGTPWHLGRRHLLPNAMGPIVVATALTVGHAILTESVLSFLGLGVQPPLASWGNMLTAAQDLVFEAPGLALLPGLMIFLSVVSINLAADRLQLRLDPKWSMRR